MKRTQKEIVKEIHLLLEELVSYSSKNQGQQSGLDKKSKNYSGPSGGIKLLSEEGFFAEPKALSEVEKRLHQEGFRYRQQVISIALLRLVRSRMLLRLSAKNEKGKETWLYAERK